MPEIFLKEQWPQLDIGEGSYGLVTILQWPDSTVRIGKYCSFGVSTAILLGGQHRTDWVSTYPFSDLWPEAGSIKGHSPATRTEVGNDVWVGAGAMILGGSIIGDGAVIAANAVVSGVVHSYAVYGGNPGRFVRWRFELPVRTRLSALQWWNWPRERIVRALPHLLNPDVEKFLDMAEGGEL